MAQVIETQKSFNDSPIQSESSFEISYEDCLIQQIAASLELFHRISWFYPPYFFKKESYLPIVLRLGCFAEIERKSSKGIVGCSLERETLIVDVKEKWEGCSDEQKERLSRMLVESQGPEDLEVSLVYEGIEALSKDLLEGSWIAQETIKKVPQKTTKEIAQETIKETYNNTWKKIHKTYYEWRKTPQMEALDLVVSRGSSRVYRRFLIQ